VPGLAWIQVDQDNIQWSEIYYKHCDECTGFVKDADFLDQLKDSSSCERKVYSMGLDDCRHVGAKPVA
jgi:hypothetical protein